MKKLTAADAVRRADALSKVPRIVELIFAKLPADGDVPEHKPTVEKVDPVITAYRALDQWDRAFVRTIILMDSCM